MRALGKGLGTEIEVLPVPIPFACRDGFNEAYYGRPEVLLEADSRLSCSAWSFVEERDAADYVEKLRNDLHNGAWDEKYGFLRQKPEFLGSLYLIVSKGNQRV